MKGGKQALGFTILETMIVLAVSGLLLISALALISGKQGTAEFQTAINDLQQQIQQVINQTESGYYPSQSDFTCTAMPGMAPVIDTNTNVSRGTNSDCLLLGNVIYFGPGNTTNSYSVYPMAAYRLTTSANPIEVTSLAEAQPTAIAQSNQDPNAPTDNVSSYLLTDGLSFVWGNSPAQGSNPFGLGFFNSLNAGADSGAGTGTTGTYQLYEFDNASEFGGATNHEQVASAINEAAAPQPGNSTGTSYSLITSPIQFCMASGSTNQSGLFSITPGLQVSLQIKGDQTC